MARNRYYYYDHERCTFVEVQPTRKRLVVRISSAALAVFVLAVVLAWTMEGLMATPEEMALKAENQALQEQLSNVEHRIAAYSEQLESLASKDQSLYRTLLEAEPISNDVRQVGVGGSDPYAAFNRFGTHTAKLLQSSTTKLDALERQISLQNASYRELSRLAEDREAWLAEMPYILPADGPVVSGYGTRRHPILRVHKMHHGLDILVTTGTPVAAAGDGVIETAATSPTYGKYVVIEHQATGYSTLYAHLSEIPENIRPGRRIKRGEVIGLSGSTGRSTGPHLHYEVRDKDGRTLNPTYFFAPSMTPTRYRALLKQAEESGISLD